MATVDGSVKTSTKMPWITYLMGQSCSWHSKQGRLEAITGS